MTFTGELIVSHTAATGATFADVEGSKQVTTTTTSANLKALGRSLESGGKRWTFLRPQSCSRSRTNRRATRRQTTNRYGYRRSLCAPGRKFVRLTTIMIPLGSTAPHMLCLRKNDQEQMNPTSHELNKRRQLKGNVSEIALPFTKALTHMKRRFPTSAYRSRLVAPSTRPVS